jgi:hypothetical protein
MNSRAIDARLIGIGALGLLMAEREYATRVLHPTVKVDRRRSNKRARRRDSIARASRRRNRR